MRRNTYFLYGGVIIMILLTILGIVIASNFAPIRDDLFILATALACFSLVVTALTKRPRLILAGLYIYLWSIGLALSYIASGIGRKMWYWLLLPLDSTLYIFLFSLLASMLVFMFQKQLLSFFGFLTGSQREEKRQKETNIRESGTYTDMYYNTKEHAYMFHAVQEKVGDAYETPQSIYPLHSPPSQEGISGIQ